MTDIDAPPASADAVDAVRAALCCARDDDDAQIAGLISAAIVQAEQFIGRILIGRECRQRLPYGIHEAVLEQSPVTGIVAVTWHIDDGAVRMLQPEEYQTEWQADGSVRIRLTANGLSRNGQALVRFRAGRASDWDGLSILVRQGIIRLVGQWYRAGDAVEPTVMPEGIRALWRGERGMRLR